VKDGFWEGGGEGSVMEAPGRFGTKVRKRNLKRRKKDASRVIGWVEKGETQLT